VVVIIYWMLAATGHKAQGPRTTKFRLCVQLL